MGQSVENEAKNGPKKMKRVARWKKFEANETSEISPGSFGVLSETDNGNEEEQTVEKDVEEGKQMHHGTW